MVNNSINNSMSSRRKSEKILTLSIKAKSASEPTEDLLLVFENISLNNTMLDVKKRILSSINVPVHHQRLIKTDSASGLKRAISDDLTLAEAGVELGWKNQRFQVPGDVLELHTDLQMREYYPGGFHWCRSWSVTSSSQRGTRMSLLMIVFVGCTVVFMVLLSNLTS